MERTTPTFLSCAPECMVAPLARMEKGWEIGSWGMVVGTACIPEFYCGHVRLGDTQAERQSR